MSSGTRANLHADDPEDFKPESWVDVAEIDDTEATKVSHAYDSCECD